MKLDQRMFLAYLFVAGYFGVIYMVIFRDKPLANGDLIKDWMLILGPPVGAIVGSLFRSDAVDEKRAQNTADALSTITAVSNNSAQTPAVQPVVIQQPADNPVPVANQPQEP